jgi:iron complex transport system substrate-binding protein
MALPPEVQRPPLLGSRERKVGIVQARQPALPGRGRSPRARRPAALEMPAVIVRGHGGCRFRPWHSRCGIPQLACMEFARVPTAEPLAWRGREGRSLGQSTRSEDSRARFLVKGPGVKIVSLLSSATEIVYALGLQDLLVGISHECDHPPDALSRPRLSRSRFDASRLTSAEIDAAVRRSMAEHGSVYEVDLSALSTLAPDIVLTQAVCEVCAVPRTSVEEAVRSLARAPAIVSLDAHTIAGILATVREVAAAIGDPARGDRIARGLSERIDRIVERVAETARPRVLALEWLSPPFSSGHWVPEMIAAAGGDDLLGKAGSRSRELGWDELTGLDPDVLLLLPCGYDLEGARADADAHRERLRELAPRAILQRRAWVANGAFFSRSGPRVVDGIEALGSALHPELFTEPGGEGILSCWQ